LPGTPILTTSREKAIQGDQGGCAYRYSWGDTKIHAVRIGVNYRFGDPFIR
jgi:hypothetical protein